MLLLNFQTTKMPSFAYKEKEKEIERETSGIKITTMLFLRSLNYTKYVMPVYIRVSVVLS